MGSHRVSPLRQAALVCLLLSLLLSAPGVCAVMEGATPLTGDRADRQHNIDLACFYLDGWTVYTGETFSFNEAVGERTKEAGFVSAPNGRGVRVIGGGVAQVATTLYQAVRYEERFSLAPFSTYGSRFTDSYAKPEDAIVTDYKAGTDFSFVNEGAAVVIRAWTDEDHVHVRLSELGGAAQGVVYAQGQTYAGKSGSRVDNIRLAAQSLTGWLLSPGETFSFNDCIGPRSREAGYKTAVNGRGVNVRGGGVAQLASTLYLSVQGLEEELPVTEKRTYGKSFNQSYVDRESDAILTDYNAGIDFCFRNDTGSSLRMEAEVDDYGWLTVTLLLPEETAIADEGEIFWEEEEALGDWVLDEDGEWYWQWDIPAE